MPSPQTLRRLRLSNDYAYMCAIKGNVISWVALKGAPPFIEEYGVTINVKTVIGLDESSQPIFRDKQTVVVTLPAEYPSRSPRFIMTSDVLANKIYSILNY